jgi:hypothetical protein
MLTPEELAALKELYDKGHIKIVASDAAALACPHLFPRLIAAAEREQELQRQVDGLERSFGEVCDARDAVVQQLAAVEAHTAELRSAIEEPPLAYVGGILHMLEDMALEGGELPNAWRQWALAVLPKLRAALTSTPVEALDRAREREEKYKQLWCAVWACPLEEYQEGHNDYHEATVKEAERQAMALAMVRRLRDSGAGVVHHSTPCVCDWCEAKREAEKLLEESKCSSTA